ncbi:hypothetical protein QVD17_06391 [Tagetes erecta]|uniref:Uncharacterized protein n=1 Tax=Tagetes erecta TaxID=13708 RepID=A0AAD8LLL3_TARER|nr:hypothetical protein QVD17_06391 [Tagetes erecta]
MYIVVYKSKTVSVYCATTIGVVLKLKSNGDSVSHLPIHFLQNPNVFFFCSLHISLCRSSSLSNHDQQWSFVGLNVFKKLLNGHQSHPFLRSTTQFTLASSLFLSIHITGFWQE